MLNGLYVLILFINRFIPVVDGELEDELSIG